MRRGGGLPVRLLASSPLRVIFITVAVSPRDCYAPLNVNIVRSLSEAQFAKESPIRCNSSGESSLRSFAQVCPKCVAGMIFSSFGVQPAAGCYPRLLPLPGPPYKLQPQHIISKIRGSLDNGFLLQIVPQFLKGNQGGWRVGQRQLPN